MLVSQAAPTPSTRVPTATPSISNRELITYSGNTVSTR